MILPLITASQKLIIFYLYKFRYLTIAQLQMLFGHKDSRRIRLWLSDLREKRYIDRIKNPKDATEPYIFCLSQRAGHILKKEEDVSQKYLLWLYKEKGKDKRFINHHLFMADCYLYFQKNKAKGSQIDFFTKQDLAGYDYFPDLLPDAYIDVKEKKDNTRYFLDYFDSNTPSGVIRYRLRQYFEYAQSKKWQENTKNAPFPAILFVLPNERRKKHINYYAKALLQKSFNDEIEIFLTTKDNLKLANANVEIWQKVR